MGKGSIITLPEAGFDLKMASRRSENTLILTGWLEKGGSICHFTPDKVHKEKDQVEIFVPRGTAAGDQLRIDWVKNRRASASLLPRFSQGAVSSPRKKSRRSPLCRQAV
ncbi:MAG: hypothetical protein WC831_00615 [Parcubacteria group bacterium]